MGKRRCSLFSQSLLVTSCASLMAPGAHAAKWESNLVLSPGLVYTDNVCLSKNNKKNDWTGVAVVTPSGSVTHETSRTKARAVGSLSVNTLTDGDLRDDGCSGNQLEDRQKYFPQMAGSLNTILVDQWVKFDAKLRIDQNRISSAAGSSEDNLDRNGNTNTYYRYSLSPYTSRKINERLSWNARYTWSEVINTEDEVSDSHRHALTTTLNGKVGPRITWTTTGRYSRTGYEDDIVNRNTGERIPREDTELKSLSQSLAYQINRTWQVNGSVGYEWNDFQSFTNNQGGTAWDVGIRWTPSRRTTVEVGQGDRFFGNTPRVNIRHQYKRHQFQGSYDKRITFQRDLATYGLGDLGGFGGSDDLLGDPLFSGGQNRFDSNGDPVDGIGTSSRINSNSAILDERATFRYSYLGRPGTLTFFGSYSKQTRAEDGRQADFGDWELTYTPLLSRKFSVLASVRWEDVRPTGFVGSQSFDNAADSDQWTYRLQYNRLLNHRMSFNMEYRFTDRQSDLELNEYQENLVAMTFNIAL